MRAFLAFLILLAAGLGPSTAQEIYGVRPGMNFKEAEAKLRARSRSQSPVGGKKVYGSRFETKRGLVTIAASKEAFESRSTARVQWVSLTATAQDVSPETASHACQRFRKKLGRALGPAQRDSLEGGASWRWEKSGLLARILCIEAPEGMRTEVLLLTEPILLS